MVFTVTNTGTPLMPTSEYKARRLLGKGRARIFKHTPFTIMIIDRGSGATQPVEYKSDTGYKHVGVSICTKKRELVSAEFELRDDEAEHYYDRRKNRRNRRSRLRYRKPRFDNRRASRQEGWLAPSVRHRMERQTDIAARYAEVVPITSVVLEMGKFDTQLLKAIENGDPIPVGTDYQHGERYGTETLREAVFTRDNHTCVCCGRGIRDGAVLHAHHIGFRKGDRTNRLPNLMTVCEKCHTAKNHKKGGKLYALEPKLRPLTGATFMTSVRFRMRDEIMAALPGAQVHIQYGAKTKLTRKALHVPKSHANDAFAVGTFHPKRRTRTRYFRKRRRNNRGLEKFYDAKFTDTRDGKTKSGAQLSCGRTNRREARHTGKDERPFRGHKVLTGRRQIRRARYVIQPGTVLFYEGNRVTAKGVHCNGRRVLLTNGRSIAIGKAAIVKLPGAWEEIKDRKEAPKAKGAS